MRMSELLEIHLVAAHLPRAIEVFGALSDDSPLVESAAGATANDDVLFPVGDAVIRISASADGHEGLEGITLGGDVASRRRALLAMGLDPGPVESSVVTIRSELANGLAVTIVDSGEARTLGQSAARLDHVALRVRDLAAACLRWTAITGVEAALMGVHPVSGGAFEAARLILGERMIELISPVPGVASSIADRLESHGEGVAALALPVNDVAAARVRLDGVGARLLWQDPHWLVHPKDACGVLVQLTPRVGH